MISNKNQIDLFFHCKKCLQEIPEQQSPSDYQKLEVGWTLKGIQVWCKIHNKNIIHIDFEKQQHPANTTQEEQ